MPLRRDATITCLNATTGEAIWKISQWTDNLAVASGYLVSQNSYDGKVYCIGKGPSATTVSGAIRPISVYGLRFC